MRKALFFLFLIGLTSTFWAYGIWIGQISGGYGIEAVESVVPPLYLSTGVSINSAALSLDQTVGLDLEGRISKFTPFFRGGLIGTLLFASNSNAMTVSADARLGLKYDGYGFFAGVAYEFLAINDVSQAIWPSEWFPEFGVGYEW